MTTITGTQSMTGVQSITFTTVFSPASITGLIAWYDASQLTGLANGDSVASWSDMSGNGYSATTNGFFTAPTYQTNIKNGKPAIRFSVAANQALRAFPVIASSSPWTMFVVAHLTGGTNARVIGSIFPSNQNWLLGWWNAFEKVAYYTGFIQDGGNGGVPGSTTWYYMTGQGDPNVPTGSLYASGVFQKSGTPSVSTNNALAFSGYEAAGTMELSDCEICEVIYYNTYLNTTDRQAVEGYLSTKYNI